MQSKKNLHLPQSDHFLLNIVGALANLTET